MFIDSDIHLLVDVLLINLLVGKFILLCLLVFISCFGVWHVYYVDIQWINYLLFFVGACKSQLISGIRGLCGNLLFCTVIKYNFHLFILLVTLLTCKQADIAGVAIVYLLFCLLLLYIICITLQNPSFSRKRVYY